MHILHVVPEGDVEDGNQHDYAPSRQKSPQPRFLADVIQRAGSRAYQNRGKEEIPQSKMGHRDEVVKCAQMKRDQGVNSIERQHLRPSRKAGSKSGSGGGSQTLQSEDPRDQEEQ